MYLVAWILFKLRNNGMFSETGEQIQKQYKITSSQMFFNYVKSTFALLFRIRCHVNRLLGWKPTIAAWLFVRHLKRCPVDSILSCFDTSCFASIRSSQFDTDLQLIQCKLKSYSAYSASRKSARPPDKHHFSPSGMTFLPSIAIICDANRKTLALGNFFKFTFATKWLQFVSNWFQFVWNRLYMCIKIDFHLCQQRCNETSVNLSNLSQTALHMRCDAIWDWYNMADGWRERTF